MNFLSQLTRSIQLQTTIHHNSKGIVDLCSLKSPYPPSPMVLKALSSYDVSKLNNYSDPEESSLRDAIADKYNLKKDNVFLHNSCDDILSLCFKAFFDPNELVIFPDVSSGFYQNCAKVNNINYQKFPLTQDMKIHLEELAKVECKGILLCNPNMPTGYMVNKLDLIELIKSKPDTLFIIDERFVEYSNSSVASYLNDVNNLVILRSFAYAYGLAGVRCGYALASQELIQGINYIHKCISRYPLDSITQTAAEACIKDQKYLIETIDKVINTREDFSEKLRELNFEVLPSSANFIFCKHNNIHASELEFLLREEGIRVRHYKNKKIDNYLRISIGKPEDMELLIKRLKKFLKEKEKDIKERV